MNGHERISAALRGDWPDKVPVMLHNFQMAVREQGITMEQFRRDPHALAGAFIAAVERYGYDGVLVDVDTATLAEAAGVPVDCPDDHPARVRGALLKDLRKAHDLRPVDRSRSRIQVWLEGTRLLKQHFGSEVFVRGNCDQCPFTLAAMIRGMDAWMMDLLDPGAEAGIRALLDYCTGITTQFITLMVSTGADMVSNGDSTAGSGVISPALYRQFAAPYEQRVVAVAHQHHLPYALHICGNTDPILESMLVQGLTRSSSTTRPTRHEHTSLCTTARHSSETLTPAACLPGGHLRTWPPLCVPCSRFLPILPGLFSMPVAPSRRRHRPPISRCL
jgi:uroporphyrinogen decarboxylase